MRVNTAKSIALGERIHRELGSWAKVLQAAELKDGVHVLPPAREGRKDAARERPKG